VARKKLSNEEIESSLSALNGWKVENDNLKKRFSFSNFAESLAFVNKVGAIAERRDHHPDICFGWGYAEFSIMTHDAGGLTQNDFALVKEIDNLTEN
jgi:4a-hydroxytetrahydrobiopterin dehydratase